ncbi:PAN domain-containing protein [Ditylenchus destructor]|nr:PAN domain-containing protein [Ditylenchus destructor]
MKRAICAFNKPIQLNHLSFGILMLMLYPHSGIPFDANHCSGSNRTVYLRTEAKLVDDPPAVTLVDVTLNECAKKCTSNVDGIDCRSFEYNSEKQSCALKESNGQPFGRSVLAETKQSGVAFFQRICIPTDELCSAPYTFDRFPQHVLSGHSMEVFVTDNLSGCLLECLESKKRMRMDCRSVMYYYETGQCILNREMHKLTSPMLFSNDTHFQLVDYFENNCFDVNCFDNTQLHWIRVEDFHISAKRDVLLSGLTAEECKQACIDNQVGIETFPCKAYVYTATKQECQLSAESGVKTSSREPLNSVESKSSVEVPIEAMTELKRNIKSELSDFSAGQYYEKACLAGDIRCKDASFELIPNKMLESRERILSTTSLSYCLEQCLLLAENCTSAMFFKETDECVLNKKSQFSHPELFKTAHRVDYYDNLCDIVPGTKPTVTGNEEYTKRKKSTMSLTIEDPELEQAGSITKITRREKPVFDSNVSDSSLNTRKETLEVVETDCHLSGIEIRVHFHHPTSGALYIKDHSMTCFSKFEKSHEVRLKFPMPSSTDSNPDCAGVELAPNVWSFVVVLQKNNIGITSLMTGSDRVFNVTCDFNNVLLSSDSDNDVVNEKLPVSASLPSETTSNKWWDINHVDVSSVRMSILRAGQPVTTVHLGEELELRWTFTSDTLSNTQKPALAGNSGFREQNKKGKSIDLLRMKRSSFKRSPKQTVPQYGFFVENCTAERLDGLPPDPPPLPLVVNGCPEERIQEQLMRNPITETIDGFNTSIKVFRFDGSRRVICLFGNRPEDESMSFGRRKKRQTIGELGELVEKYDEMRDEVLRKKLGNGETVQQSTITGSYTIVDNGVESTRNSIIAPQPTTIDDTNLMIGNGLLAQNDTKVVIDNKLQHSTNTPEQDCGTSSNTSMTKPSSVCLQRPAFIGLLVVVAFLSTVQLLYITQKLCKKYATEAPNQAPFKEGAWRTPHTVRETEPPYVTYLHSPSFPTRSNGTAHNFLELSEDENGHNNGGYSMINSKPLDRPPKPLPKVERTENPNLILRASNQSTNFPATKKRTIVLPKTTKRYNEHPTPPPPLPPRSNTSNRSTFIDSTTAGSVSIRGDRLSGSTGSPFDYFDFHV